jgi:nicotinate-nucleotide adenylyltransferase
VSHRDSPALFGGAFDPPHNGHVALARAAKRHFEVERLVVLVAAHPGHKHVATSPETRLDLARAAFPDDDVRLDEHARTVDLLREGEWADPLFLIGADQLRDFPTWKDPDEVLRLARLGVATRPGYPRVELEAVLAQLARPDRVELFEIPPQHVASRDVRARAAAAEPLGGLVPPAVAALIEGRGLYRP